MFADCRTASDRVHRRSSRRWGSSSARSQCSLGSSGGDLAAVSPVSWLFFGAVVLVAVATAVLALVRPPTRTLFRLVMLAALLLAAQLVATGGAVAA